MNTENKVEIVQYKLSQKEQDLRNKIIKQFFAIIKKNLSKDDVSPSTANCIATSCTMLLAREILLQLMVSNKALDTADELLDNYCDVLKKSTHKFINDHLTAENLH